MHDGATRQSVQGRDGRHGMKRKLFIVPTQAALKQSKFVTTVFLTHAQRVAIEELKLKRMLHRKKKTFLKDILIEGLELLLRKEKIK